MKEHLLLLHGALGCKTQLEGIADILSKHFQIHTLNFAGHGGREIDEDYSIDLFVQNVRTYLDTHKIASIRIFGYSMGGYVALKLAENFPANVREVVTLGTKFDWSPKTAAKEVSMLNPGIIEEKVPHFAQFLKRIHEPLDWKEVVTGTARMMLNLSAGGSLEQQNFAKITIPVFLGLGENDRMVTPHETEQVKNWLPNSAMTILGDTPHPIEKTDPEKISTFILNSLTSSNA